MKSYLMSTQPAESAGESMQPHHDGNAFRIERERPKPNLTERENDVLRLVCAGLTNAEIAACLHVSRETVKSELKRIFRKIGVSTRAAAALWAMQHSVVQ